MDQNSDDKAKRKNYETEWSFSFDKLGDSLNKALQSLGGDQEVKTDTIVEPLGEASEAAILLNLSLGEATITALEPGSPNLFEAELRYIGEIEYDCTGGVSPSLRLRQKDQGVAEGVKRVFGSVANREDLRWDVRISPDVPLRLKVKGGVGRANLNLEGLQLLSLEVEGGVGEPRIKLPATAHSYDVEIEGGVGATAVRLPQDTSINLEIEGGVGTVRVLADRGTAIQLKAEAGIGTVRVPPEMPSLKEERELLGRSGVWQTEGFDMARDQVRIDFEGGVGTLELIYE